MTTNDLDQAREWAKDVRPGYNPEAVATAKVIASLPDEWIDADKLREVIKEMREEIATAQDTRFDNIYCKSTDWWAEQLEKLLPTPQPRTLKDMTPEEREACRWAQADYEDGFTEHPVRVIITVTYPNVVDILLPNGTRNCVRNEEVTPRLDLPRMVWPEEPATTSDDEGMAPEVVPVREPWIVEYNGERYVGVRDPYESPHWAMAQMDGTDIYFADDFAVTLVSRLVPEVKA